MILEKLVGARNNLSKKFFSEQVLSLKFVDTNLSRSLTGLSHYFALLRLSIHDLFCSFAKYL